MTRGDPPTHTGTQIMSIFSGFRRNWGVRSIFLDAPKCESMHRPKFSETNFTYALWSKSMEFFHQSVRNMSARRFKYSIALLAAASEFMKPGFAAVASDTPEFNLGN